MVKELERAGIPTVLICTLTSIAESVGANRIHPALGIPHPLGDPKLARDEEIKRRLDLVSEAVKRLCELPQPNSNNKE